MDLKTKALMVIEFLLSGESSLDAEQVRAVFMVAHAALQQCKNPHADVIEEIEQSFTNIQMLDKIDPDPPSSAAAWN